MDEIVIDSASHSADELQPALQGMIQRYSKLKILNVSNHRFLLSGFSGNKKIEIFGDPGNCFANLIDGPEVAVHGDCEDDVCDAMQDGTVRIYGNVGDVACQAMQGGQVFIKGDVGNRAGMQMREFREKAPIMVIGGTAHDFLGEYMVGGVVILLNADNSQEPVGFTVGSGMIGGKIYIRGVVDTERIGLNPDAGEILAYLTAHHRDEDILETCRRVLEKKRRVSLQMLRELVSSEEVARIRDLFYEGVHELRVETRELNGDEIDGRVGSHIRNFCTSFGFEPGEFLNSTYTVICPDP